MLANARPLAVGLIAGAVLALLLQTLLHLPSLGPAEQNLASTGPHVFLQNMALSLRNSLQIAQRALHRSGYKSARLIPSVLQQTQLASPSVLASPSLPTKAFSTSTAAMSSTKTFLQAVKDRRTIYQLNKEAPISDEKIVEIAKQIILDVPSSFNSQSARLVVLLNKEHDTFWDQVRDTLKPVVPEDQWESHTVPRLNGFKAAYGTVSIADFIAKVDAFEVSRRSSRARCSGAHDCPTSSCKPHHRRFVSPPPPHAR